jgi:UDP-2-acetamido-3-amino-2,3-dideoxy-glucuronate N-acetyltransferase
MFINDRRPLATAETGRLQTKSEWRLSTMVIDEGASLGSGATTLGGVKIGAGAGRRSGAVVRPAT